jgi:Flp pilus assembly protein TadG
MRADLQRRARRGHAALELLLVMPLLLAVLVGTVEFALFLTAQQQVNLAAREGARVAATGGSIDDINQAVRLSLGDGRFQQAIVQPQLTNQDGNPLQSGQRVSVLVQLPASAAVPDLLVFIGLSIRNQTLVGQTVMRKE